MTASREKGRKKKWTSERRTRFVSFFFFYFELIGVWSFILLTFLFVVAVVCPFSFSPTSAVLCVCVCLFIGVSWRMWCGFSFLRILRFLSTSPSLPLPVKQIRNRKKMSPRLSEQLYITALLFTGIGTTCDRALLSFFFFVPLPFMPFYSLTRRNTRKGEALL